jgi:hypothetical protein
MDLIVGEKKREELLKYKTHANKIYWSIYYNGAGIRTEE